MSGGRSTLICKGKPKDSLAAQNTYSGALRSHTPSALCQSVTVSLQASCLGEGKVQLDAGWDGPRALAINKTAEQKAQRRGYRSSGQSHLRKAVEWSANQTGQ